jgi:dTDP-4-amino-4,6-dideoxygalactose transaminase
MNKPIGFNKPYYSGKEADYIKLAVESRKISGDGIFTKKCHDFFEARYGFKKALLTTSCTDALELAALLLDIQPGDEVIAPSYTFVSTVNPFILRGAKIVFADSTKENPNIDSNAVESLITEKTKVILPVHYAGIACEMDILVALSQKHNLHVVEDAAQAVDSYYNGRPLGSIGSLGAFSFHETKNIISGEGGMLTINDPGFIKRAEILREKGTNRSAFFRGEIDKYGWVDVGSSFLPSEIVAAYLYAQLERLDDIQARRKQIWELYDAALKRLGEQGLLQLPFLPAFATNNAHMYYVVTRTAQEREALIAHLKAHGINAVFHYLSLHKSQYYKDRHDGRTLRHSERYSDCLIRLPFYMELSDDEVMYVSEIVTDFFKL